MLDLELFESSGDAILLAATAGKVIVKNQNGAILQRGGHKIQGKQGRRAQITIHIEIYSQSSQ